MGKAGAAGRSAAAPPPAQRGNKRQSAGGVEGAVAPLASASDIDEMFAAIPKGQAKAKAAADAAAAAAPADARPAKLRKRGAPPHDDARASAREPPAERRKEFFLDNGEKLVPVTCAAPC